MADSTKIKGITIEIGGDTQPLSKALKGVNTEAGNLQSELRLVNKLLKLDPSNVTLLKQKQDILSEAIEKTSKKLEILTKAQKQAKQQLDNGEISAEQYRALERQVLQTRTSLERLQDQTSEMDYSLANLGDQSIDTSSDFQQMNYNFQQSEKGMKNLSTLGVALGTVFGNAVSKILDKLGEMVSFIFDSVEATKEFRSDLSKLEMNASAANTGLESVTDELEYLIAVTDESDSSVEALSNLLKAGFTEETLTQVVNNLAGAVIQFPDTLKIESLADSLQETLATGAATGQYGELLERLGVNLDDFNAGLQKCTTAAEKQQYAVDILAKHGLADINEQYKQANADLIAYSTAQTKYTEAMAKVGNAMQPIMTAFTNIKTTLLEAMVPALQKTADALTKKLASPSVQASIERIGKAIGEVASGFAEFATFVIANGEAILRVIVAIGSIILSWKITSILSTIIAAFKNFANAVVGVGKKVIETFKAMDKASVILTIITTAISVIANLASAFLAASQEAQNLKDDMIALGDEAASMQGEWAATSESLALNADTMRSLTGEIQALDEKIRSGKLSSAELAQAQAELQVKTTQYNAAAGEEILKIDSVTGAILGGTSALDGNTEALIKNAEKQAQVNALEDAYKGQTENKAKEAEAITKITGLKDKMNKKQKEIVERLEKEELTQELLNEAHNAFSDYLHQNDNEVRTYLEGLDEAVIADEEFSSTIDYLTGVIESNTGAQEENAAATGEVETAVKSLTEQEALQLLRRQENGEQLTQLQQDQLESYKAKA